MTADIVLSSEDANEALELFVSGMREGVSSNLDGNISLDAATELLRNAFETARFVGDPAGTAG